MLWGGNGVILSGVRWRRFVKTEAGLLAASWDKGASSLKTRCGCLLGTGVSGEEGSQSQVTGIGWEGTAVLG